MGILVKVLSKALNVGVEFLGGFLGTTMGETAASMIRDIRHGKEEKQKQITESA